MTKRRAGMTKRRARSDSLFYLSWNECEASHNKALNASSSIFEHPKFILVKSGRCDKFYKSFGDGWLRMSFRRFDL